MLDFESLPESGFISSSSPSPRVQEIDGKAFLLLNSDMLMKYMKIKLGPALKISQLIEKLKEHL